MAKSVIYDRNFYQRNHTSAATTISHLMVDLLHPASVVDVGCGNGEFLEMFREQGVNEVLGIDGDYVDRDLLCIPQEHFQACNISLPFTLEKSYDLALCLEVAEHLDSACATSFIDSLTRLAPVILFSAAIPFQGGTHHVNEQWLEYWAKLFQEKGFLPVDALRKKIWHNGEIEFWYRQNSILFCTEQAIASNERLSQEFAMTNPTMLSIVHPEWYTECNTKYLRLLHRGLEQVEEIKNTTRKIARNIRSGSATK